MNRIFLHRRACFPVCLAINLRVYDAAVARDHTHAAHHRAICNSLFHVICNANQTCARDTLPLRLNRRNFPRVPDFGRATYQHQHKQTT